MLAVGCISLGIGTGVVVATGMAKLIARIAADAQRIAELERVCGPVMACGCYAVKGVLAIGSKDDWFRCNVPEHDAILVTPEYRAWRDR